LCVISSVTGMKNLYHISMLFLIFTMVMPGAYGNKAFSGIRCNKNLYHPVHISYTNIEYNKEKGKFEILFKLFVDDFDLILNAKYGKDLNLKGGRWENSYIITIEQYISEHFKIRSGKKDISKESLNFVRKEINEGSIWLYFELKTKEKKHIFEVRNSLMMDLYQDQNNLLIFSYEGVQKAFKFNNSAIEEVFSF